MVQVIFQEVDHIEVAVRFEQSFQMQARLFCQVLTVLQKQILGAIQHLTIISCGFPELLQTQLIDDFGLVANHVELVKDRLCLRGSGFESIQIGVPHVEGDGFDPAGDFIADLVEKGC
jgi:hypothetical protein